MRTTNQVVADFLWGDVIEREIVGPYLILSYHPHKVRGGIVSEAVDYNRTSYHPFVNHVSLGWLDTRHSYDNLDSALAGAIAYRVEGPNHHADVYFIRSLKESA